MNDPNTRVDITASDSIYITGGGSGNYGIWNDTYVEDATATTQSILKMTSKNITVDGAKSGIVARQRAIVDLTATDKISIVSNATNADEDGAVWAQNNTVPSQNATKFATINLIANEIDIQAKDAGGVVAYSEGRVNIVGNTIIDATNSKKAIMVRGDSIVNINADTDEYTTKIIGDINFNYADTTSVDAYVNVNLNGTGSSWQGNTIVSWEGDKPAESMLKAEHANVALKNGATWTATAITDNDNVSHGSKYTALNNLTVDNANVVIQDTTNGVSIENLVAKEANISGGVMHVTTTADLRDGIQNDYTGKIQLANNSSVYLDAIVDGGNVGQVDKFDIESTADKINVEGLTVDSLSATKINTNGYTVTTNAKNSLTKYFASATDGTGADAGTLILGAANQYADNQVVGILQNGNYIKAFDASNADATSVAGNLVALDNQVFANANAISANADAIATNTANIAANTTAIAGKQDVIDTEHKLSYTLVDGLANVAHSGNFSDLTVADGAIAQAKVAGLGTAASANLVKLEEGDAAEVYTKAKADSTFATTAIATTSANGLMAAADKSKLDGIEANAEANVLEGVKLNGTALTPDANKVVNVNAATKATINGVTEVSVDENGVLALTDSDTTYAADNSTLVLNTTGNVFSVKDGGITFAKMNGDSIQAGTGSYAGDAYKLLTTKGYVDEGLAGKASLQDVADAGYATISKDGYHIDYYNIAGNGISTQFYTKDAVDSTFVKVSAQSGSNSSDITNSGNQIELRADKEESSTTAYISTVTVSGTNGASETGILLKAKDNTADKSGTLQVTSTGAFYAKNNNELPSTNANNEIATKGDLSGFLNKDALDNNDYGVQLSNTTSSFDAKAENSLNSNELHLYNDNKGFKVNSLTNAGTFGDEKQSVFTVTGDGAFYAKGTTTEPTPTANDEVVTLATAKDGIYTPASGEPGDSGYTPAVTIAQAIAAKQDALNLGKGLEFVATGADAGKLAVKLDGTTLAAGTNGLKVNEIAQSQVTGLTGALAAKLDSSVAASTYQTKLGAANGGNGINVSSAGVISVDNGAGLTFDTDKKLTVATGAGIKTDTSEGIAINLAAKSGLVTVTDSNSADYKKLMVATETGDNATLKIDDGGKLVVNKISDNNVDPNALSMGKINGLTGALADKVDETKIQVATGETTANATIYSTGKADATFAKLAEANNFTAKQQFGTGSGTDFVANAEIDTNGAAKFASLKVGENNVLTVADKLTGTIADATAGTGVGLVSANQVKAYAVSNVKLSTGEGTANDGTITFTRDGTDEVVAIKGWANKQAKLKNDVSGTEAPIESTVLTTIRAANAADNTHLVTESAIRTALNGITLTAGNGININDSNQIEVVADPATDNLLSVSSSGVKVAKAASIASDATGVATGGQVYNFAVSDVKLSTGEGTANDGTITFTRNGTDEVVAIKGWANKANVALDNINADGQNVVQDLAGGTAGNGLAYDTTNNKLAVKLATGITPEQTKNLSGLALSDAGLAVNLATVAAGDLVDDNAIKTWAAANAEKIANVGTTAQVLGAKMTIFQNDLFAANTTQNSIAAQLVGYVDPESSAAATDTRTLVQAVGDVAQEKVASSANQFTAKQSFGTMSGTPAAFVENAYIDTDGTAKFASLKVGTNDVLTTADKLDGAISAGTTGQTGLVSGEQVKAYAQNADQVKTAAQTAANAVVTLATGADAGKINFNTQSGDTTTVEAKTYTADAIDTELAKKANLADGNNLYGTQNFGKDVESAFAAQAWIDGDTGAAKFESLKFAGDNIAKSIAKGDETSATALALATDGFVNKQIIAADAIRFGAYTKTGDQEPTMPAFAANETVGQYLYENAANALYATSATGDVTIKDAIDTKYNFAAIVTSTSGDTPEAKTADTPVYSALKTNELLTAKANLAGGNTFTGDQSFNGKSVIMENGTAGFGMNDANTYYAFVVQKDAITANQSIAAKAGITFGAAGTYGITDAGVATLGATQASSLKFADENTANSIVKGDETATTGLALATTGYATKAATDAASTKYNFAAIQGTTAETTAGIDADTAVYSAAKSAELLATKAALNGGNQFTGVQKFGVMDNDDFVANAEIDATTGVASFAGVNIGDKWQIKQLTTGDNDISFRNASDSPIFNVDQTGKMRLFNGGNAFLTATDGNLSLAKGSKTYFEAADDGVRFYAASGEAMNPYFKALPNSLNVYDKDTANVATFTVTNATGDLSASKGKFTVVTDSENATKVKATVAGDIQAAGLTFNGSDVATSIAKGDETSATALALATDGFVNKQIKAADDIRFGAYKKTGDTEPTMPAFAANETVGQYLYENAANALYATSATGDVTIKDAIDSKYNFSAIVTSTSGDAPEAKTADTPVYSALKTNELLDLKMNTADWTVEETGSTARKLNGALIKDGSVAFKAINPSDVITSEELATATLDDAHLVTAGAVFAGVNNLFNDKQAWASEVLGYDTAQSIASQLEPLGFVAKSGKLGFLQAVAQNRELFEAKDNAGAKYTVVESIQKALSDPEQDIVADTVTANEVDTKALKVVIPAADPEDDNVILEAGVDDQDNNVISLNGATTVDGGLTADTLTMGGNTVDGFKVADNTGLPVAFDNSKLATSGYVEQVIGINPTTHQLTFNEGSLKNISEGDGNNRAAPTTVVGAIENISYAMGLIHGLVTEDPETHIKTFNGTSIASTNKDAAGHYIGNLVAGTSVSDDLVGLDNALGAVSTLNTDVKDSIVAAVNDMNDKVVHKAGAETIDGMKTFKNGLYVGGDDATSYKWNLYNFSTASSDSFVIKDKAQANSLVFSNDPTVGLYIANGGKNYLQVKNNGIILSNAGTPYLQADNTRLVMSDATHTYFAATPDYTRAYNAAGDVTLGVTNATGDVFAKGIIQSAGLTFSGATTVNAIVAPVDADNPTVDEQTIATKAYADTKISKDAISTAWPTDLADLSDEKVTSEKLVYNSIHGDGTDGSTVSFGDRADIVNIGQEGKAVNIKGATTLDTLKFSGDGDSAISASGIKNVVEANTDGKNYLVTSAAVYAKTGDANFAAGNYIEAHDNLTQAAQHLDTKVFADIHGTGDATTPAGTVKVGDLASKTEIGNDNQYIHVNGEKKATVIGNSAYSVRIDSDKKRTVFKNGSNKVTIEGNTITAENADTSSVYGAASMILNGSHAVTGIDPAKTATPTADEKILATKGTVKGAIEDLLKSNNVWTGTNEFQNTLTATYMDGETKKEIFRAGLNGSVPEVTISGRTILNDTLQFGTGDSVIKVDGIVDDIYDSSLTTPSTKLANVAGIVNALQGTGTVGETIYFGSRAEKVQIGKTGYNMTIDTENGKTVISDGSTDGTVTMDHGKLTAGTSVQVGADSAAHSKMTDDTISIVNGSVSNVLTEDSITMTGTSGVVFSVDENGSMTAGKNGANGQFALDTENGTASIATKKDGRTAQINADGESVVISTQHGDNISGLEADGDTVGMIATNGTNNYGVVADIETSGKESVFVGVTKETGDDDTFVAGMEASDDSVGMGVGDNNGELLAGFSVEKKETTNVIEMGAFDVENDKLATGVKVDSAAKTVTLAADSHDVMTVSYDTENNKGAVNVAGDVKADSFTIGENSVDAIDNGSTAQSLNPDGSFKDGQQTTMATVATVLKNAGNAEFVAGDQSSWLLSYNEGEIEGKPTTIAGALDRLATNLDAATNDLGDWSKLSDHVNATGYAGNIDKTTGETPYSKPSAVSAIIDLDNAIGERALYKESHYANKTADVIPVADAIANMDTAVFQDIHGKGEITTDPETGEEVLNAAGKVKVGDLAKITEIGNENQYIHVNGKTGATAIGTDDYKVKIDSANGVTTFNAGADQTDKVKIAGGTITAKDAENESTYGADGIAVNTDKFTVDADGNMTAAAGDLSVVKDATSGKTTMTLNGDEKVRGNITVATADDAVNKVEIKNDGTVTANQKVTAGVVGEDGTLTSGVQIAADGSITSKTATDTLFTVDTNGNTTTKANLSADANGFTVTHHAGDPEVPGDTGYTQVTVAGDVDTQSLTMADAKAGEPKATVTAIDTAKAVQALTDEYAITDAQKATLATVGTVLNSAENAIYRPIDDLKAGGTDYATAGSHTLNEAIADIDLRIGDFAQLHKDTADPTKLSKNLTYNGTIPATGDSTVVDMFNGIDSTLGTIHGLAESLGDDYQGNLDEGDTSSVEKHLTAIDKAIGDRNHYTEPYNISNGQSVAESLDAMDLRMGDVASLGREMHYYSDPNPASVNLSSAVKSLDSNLYRLEMDHKKLRHETHAGLASAAALSALVPNPRGTGDTTLSFGTGAYQGHTAAAFGGFHWITNNLLVNAGVGWDNREATTRIGVSYSF